MAIGVASVSVWAKAKSDSGDAITATITLTATTTVGGTQLAPGQYKVVVEGNQAKFEQKSKVVAEVPCTLKDISYKPTTTEFVLDHDHISEIQVSGKTKAIEFSTAQ